MVKRCLLTGLVAGFLSISSTLYPVKLTDTRGVKEYVESFLFNGVYAGESEIILKDNTTASGLTVKEETANTTIARFRGDGNVGIGTTSPTGKLDVVGTDSGITILNLKQYGTGDTNYYRMLRARGTANSPSAVLSGDHLGFLTFLGYGATSFPGYTGYIYMKASENFTDTTLGGDMYFATTANGTGNPATRIFIENRGNVGIGTTAPLAKLDVNGDAGTIALDRTTRAVFSASNILGTGANIDKTALAVYSSDAPATDVGGAIALGGKYSVSNDTVLTYGIIVGASEGAELSGPGYLSFRTRPAAANTVERMRITSTGNVGIGTTAPSEKLEVSGNIKASGTVSQGSSRELKKNISYISTKEAMKALNGLKPVRFEYKADNFGEEHLGFIAEDVPALVAEQDRKHLSPMDLTAVITKVVQEQQRMLQAQQEAMDKMKQEIKMLKSAMNYGVKGL